MLFDPPWVRDPVEELPAEGRRPKRAASGGGQIRLYLSGPELVSSPWTFAASVALTERGEAITKLMQSSSEHLGGFTPFFYYIFFNCITSIFIENE